MPWPVPVLVAVPVPVAAKSSILQEWTLRVRVLELISAGSTLDFILANFWQSVKKVPKLVPCAMNK